MSRYCKSVVDLSPEVSDRNFDFRGGKGKLHRTEVARAPIDQGRHCSAQ